MKNIIYILLILLTASCATEKNYVNFHKKNDLKSAGYCGIWYPVKSDTTTTTKYIQGETVIIPGETQFVTSDCDSQIQAMADYLSKQKGNKKGKVVYIRVPGEKQVDTVERTKVIVEENTATQIMLRDSIALVNKNYDKINKDYAGVKKTRNILWGSLGGLFVLGACAFVVKNWKLV
jgi:hypothetical protein